MVLHVALHVPHAPHLVSEEWLVLGSQVRAGLGLKASHGTAALGQRCPKGCPSVLPTLPTSPADPGSLPAAAAAADGPARLPVLCVGPECGGHGEGGKLLAAIFTCCLLPSTLVLWRIVLDSFLCWVSIAGLPSPAGAHMHDTPASAPS